MPHTKRVNCNWPRARPNVTGSVNGAEHGPEGACPRPRELGANGDTNHGSYLVGWVLLMLLYSQKASCRKDLDAPHRLKKGAVLDLMASNSASDCLLRLALVQAHRPKNTRTQLPLPQHPPPMATHALPTNASSRGGGRLAGTCGERPPTHPPSLTPSTHSLSDALTL